jgi:predicted dehydrogenase/nucleoside-diphosphate-sugar epimerase
MTQSLKIALLGCGQIAHVHYRFIQKLGYSVSAVCDASKIRAETFGEQYQIKHICTSVDELFANDAPDIVHILVPPHLHKTLAIDCLQRGAHVVIEKPVCETSADLQAIQDAADKAGKQFVVDHTRVYNPSLIKIREQLATGAYGNIVRLEYDYDDPSVVQTGDINMPLAYAKGTPPWLARLKGGVLTDLLPHPVSVLLSLRPELQLQSTMGKICNGIVSDAVIYLKDDEVTALIKLSVNIRPLHNQLKIFCEHGTITLDLRNLFCIFSPERKLPNIIARILDTLSNAGQMFGNFSMNTVRILSGKLHTYSGLDDILRQFYQAIESNCTAQIAYLNTEKVVALSENILNQLMHDQPDYNEQQNTLRNAMTNRLTQTADVLVTGASGFIGSTLIHELAKQKIHTRGLCRSLQSAKKLPENAAICLGNMNDSNALIAAMSGVKTVYHCAAAMQGDWADFYETTVKGTENLLSAFAESQAQQLIYVSSLGILDYDQLHDGDLVDESAALEKSPALRGFYTRAKKEAEDLVQEFILKNPQKNIWIVRPGLVYGAQSNNNLNNSGVLIGKLLLAFGMGERQLGLCQVNNLARVLAALKDSTPQPNQHILHITDSEQPTVKNYIREHNQLCLELNQSNLSVSVIYVPIFVWRSAFWAVDKLLSWKNGRNPAFSYRFNSNAKTLRFTNLRSRSIAHASETTFNDGLRDALINK